METLRIFAIVLASMAAIALTVLAFIFILPAKRAHSTNKFVVFLHDLCNFKFLIIDKILKACYIFGTVFCIIYGFFSLFSFNVIPHYSNNYYYESTVWTGYIGFAIMIAGPIVLRIAYELIMAFIILVQNSNAIAKSVDNIDVKTPEIADETYYEEVAYDYAEDEAQS